MAKTLITIPVLNEADSLPEVLAELRELTDIDILVIDDSSTDDSMNICQALGITVLPLKIQLGAWGATQTGLRYARMHDYEFVITMDGDGQHHARDIPRLMEAAETHPDSDVIIGECIARGSRLRHIAWRYFRLITGLEIADITSGFRLYRKNAIRLLTSHHATMLEYQDVGVLLMLKAAGIKKTEIRISTTPRLHGKSHLFSTWMKVSYYMVVTTILALSKFGVKNHSH